MAGSSPTNPNANNLIFVQVDSAQRPSIAKGMAYGPSTVQSINDSGVTFRLDRGRTYYRFGVPVKSIPQFKAQKIVVTNTDSAALQTSTSTGATTVSYPTGAQVSQSGGNTKELLPA